MVKILSREAVPMIFGRRQSFILAAFFFFVATIWGGVTHSFKGSVAARLISYFPAAAGEVVAVMIIITGLNAISIFLFFPGMRYVHVTRIEKADSSPYVVESGPPNKSFFQELKPWVPFDLVYPFTIFVTFAWLLSVVNTNASEFQGLPYSGLINIPGTIGIVAGVFCSGPLSDRFAQWMAHRNNGIYEPETRLITLVVPFFFVPFGLLMHAP
jgi:hypothetical protein